MLKKIFYSLLIIIILTLGFTTVKSGSYSAFIDFAENKTFDIRQEISAGSRHHNDNIAIIAIDDASYEYILDKYGEWPLRRDIYAKMIDFLENQNPKSIAFDLMFVKSMRSNENADKLLANAFKKYNNIYTAMNLDNQEEDLRVPADLPEKLQLNLDGNIYPLEYTNCRTIIEDIMNSTSNIGMINVMRSDDGVLRKMPLFLKYKDKFYPQLGLKAALGAMNANNQKDFVIKNNNLILPNGKKIYVDDDGSVILNWYGSAGTFENIPMYKVLNAMEGKGKLENFENKIIYIGATASSLFDIKTVPTDKVFPGVEVQATYVNNLLDGSVIRKTSTLTNVLINISIALLTIAAVALISSMPLALGIIIVIYGLYTLLSYEFMTQANLWIEVVSPLSLGIFSFILAVIVKYLIKSRDFDEQYKLATTDGLTELFNHRYFQEQLKLNVEHAKRYGNIFSLIIIDIDFFKNFNDNYGHQSGDAVLKQISTTLKRNVRSTDIVCRYGGEELCIVLPNTSREEAVNIAQKLCSIVSEKKLKLANNKESNVTISLGVSTFGNEDGTTPEEIISSADKRLYNAKANGRNRVN